jgi:hypothetical protein
MSLSQWSSHPSYAMSFDTSNNSDDFALNDTLSTCLLEKNAKNAGVKKKNKQFWFPRHCKICEPSDIFTLPFDNESVLFLMGQTTNQE